jgi:general secretion pathway protein L
MSSVIVLLPLQPATAATEFSYVLTTDGRSVAKHASAPPALLPLPTGAGAEVVAIAPASAISWHQVDLPKGITARSPRLRTILEGLLEERLLDEPEALHFAVQPQARPGEPVWVAVCDRAWLRNAVQVLEAAQRPAARIVPEFAPQDTTALFVLGEPQDATLVASGSHGVVTLPLTAAALPLLPALTPETVVRAEPAVAALAEQVLQREVRLRQVPELWLRSARSAWDLAQGEFASSGRARTFKKFAGGWAEVLRAPQWRPVRWAALLLIAINLAGLNAWAWKERSALESKRVAIETALTRTFPQVKTVVAPVVQMEKEVALLRQATGASAGNDLEAMLGALSATAPQAIATAVEFNGAGLRIKGPAASPDQARDLSLRLKSQGYAAQLQGEWLVLTHEAAP